MGTIIGEGITFDDVLLVPAYSEVIPNQVDLSTTLTKTIKLNIPMMSAITARRKYFRKLPFSSPILFLAAFESFCTSS